MTPQLMKFNFLQEKLWKAILLTSCLLALSAGSALADIVPIEKNIKKMAVNDNSICTITNTNELYCFGNNEYGQIGKNAGTKPFVYSPVKTLSSVKYVNSDASRKVVLKTNGDLYYWGWHADPFRIKTSPVKILSGVEKADDYYALKKNGDLYKIFNYEENQDTPTPKKILSNVSAISESMPGPNGHTCALQENGDLYCWGCNAWGEIGNGSTSSSVSSPVKVLTNISSVGLGYRTTCAIDKKKDLYCWGSNRDGEAGYEKTNGNVNRPIKVGISNVVKVIPAFSHSCAIDINGDLYCWGDNLYHQVHENIYTGYKPYKILENVSKVSVSKYRTCALKTDGTLRCFGDIPSQDNKTIESLNNISDVTITDNLTCVLSTEGEFACLAHDEGMKFISNVYKPKSVINDVDTVELGDHQSCSIKTNGDLYCWGLNHNNSIRNNSKINMLSPAKVLSNVSNTKIGLYDGCLVNDNHELYCWGYSFDKPSGRAYQFVSKSKKILDNVTATSVGSSHFCALTTDKELYCWGSNLYGQIGAGASCTTNVGIQKVLCNVNEIVTSTNHNCAITTNNDLYCWGNNKYGQVGNGDSPLSVFKPTKVLSDVSRVVLEADRSCAITLIGDLYCWGNNENGQIGTGTADKTILTPTKILDSIVNVSLGEKHSCAVNNSKKLFCWGNNENGQIGNSATGMVYAPIEILNSISNVSLGANHSCAVNTSKNLYCWGNNENGQIGTGSTKDVLKPTKVLTSVASVTLKQNHSCAIDASKTLYCWGDASYGQLGLGNPLVEIFNMPSSIANPESSCNGHWNYSNVGYSCDNGELGACLNSGTLGCYGTEEDPSVICDAEKGTPSAEMCDGIDNDCDGQIDEDFVLLGKTCYVENDECKLEGVYVCNGTGTECSVTDECPQPNNNDNQEPGVNDDEEPNSDDDNNNEHPEPDVDDNQEPDIDDNQEPNPDANNNGIPDIYEKSDDTKIVRPDSELVQSYVVKGKKKATLYFEWFSAASFNKVAKVNEKKLPFKYYVRIKVTDKKTGKLVSTSFITTKANKFAIRLNKTNKSYKFKVDYRVVIKKGQKKKKTSWSPKVTF